MALAWALEHPADVSALIPLSAVSNHWTQPLDPMYRINSHPLGAALLVPLISAFATAKGLAPLLDKIFAPQAPPPRYTEMIGLDLSLRHRTLVANAGRSICCATPSQRRPSATAPSSARSKSYMATPMASWRWIFTPPGLPNKSQGPS